MGEQRNLTEENVDELKAKLVKMQETNPASVDAVDDQTVHPQRI